MTLLLFLIFNHLIFTSSRKVIKIKFQEIFKTNLEESNIMIFIQYVLVLIINYIIVFLIFFVFIKSELFYFNPHYLFEELNNF